MINARRKLIKRGALCLFAPVLLHFFNKWKVYDLIDKTQAAGPRASQHASRAANTDAAFPDATNTGVNPNLTLTPVSSVASSSIGQTFQQMHISAKMSVSHADVTVKQCLFTSSDAFPLETFGEAVRFVVQDCTFICPGSAAAYLPGGKGAKMQRCNISGSVNGCNIGGDGQVWRDNYIHSLSNNPEAHVDGIQSNGGFVGATIEHNSIWSRDTSCILLLDNAFGAFSEVVINKNLLVMQRGSACIYCHGDTPRAGARNVNITNNHMGAGASYNSIIDVVDLTYTGNVDYLTGAPVEFYN